MFDSLKINGEEIRYQTDHQMAWLILMVLDIYSPGQVFKENLIEACQFVYDECSNRYLKIKISKSIKFFKRIKNKKKLLTEYYNLLLSLEKLGLLGGFSVMAPIQQGDSNYNPERRTLYGNIFQYEESYWDEEIE